MPVVFQIDAREDLARVRIEGRVTTEEVLQYRRDLLADPAFRPGMSVLVDATTADTTAISGSALESIAENLVALSPGAAPGRLAVVVESNATFGLARRYEVLTEGAPTRVRAFRDEAEAMEWIRSAGRST